MSAEIPQPAAAEAPQPSAQDGAKSKQGGNQGLRIGILVVIAALIGVGLWLAFGHSSTKHKKRAIDTTPVTRAIGPVALTQIELRNKASIIGQPMYLSLIHI